MHMTAKTLHFVLFVEAPRDQLGMNIHTISLYIHIFQNICAVSLDISVKCGSFKTGPVLALCNAAV